MPTWAHFILACILAPRGSWSGHSHKPTPAGYGCVGVVRRGAQISEGKGREGREGRMKAPSGDILHGFNCFCSFTLALCTELEVWHFKVSFYRNKCQERWVILISLKINQGCQRNQNFVLKFSRQESKSLPTLWVCAAAWGNPASEGSMGPQRLEIGSRENLGFGLYLTRM